MTHRLSGSYRLGSPILVCLFLPGVGLAQAPAPADPPGLIRRPDWEAAAAGNSFSGPPPGGCAVGVAAGPVFGPGSYHNGWPYGPRVAPPWGYYGLGGGPFVGYSGRSGSTWSNGLSLYGPPVPTYGPIPGVFGNNDLGRQWHAVPSPGLRFGWFGVYAASPRPRPLTVNVWPTIEGFQNPNMPAPIVPKHGGCLILSVKVPQPAAEVIVDGVKTTQTGSDRLFESPILEAGTTFKYEITTRWVERGVTYEKTKVVTGTPGEVVRVDFTAPEVIVTGK